jgi:hypothetical protein
MTIDLFGYKIDLEIIILIAVLYLIIVVHTLSCVTKVEGASEFILESFSTIKNDLLGKKK